MKKILFILCFLPVAVFGQVRADQLPEISSPADTDITIAVRGGSFWKIPLSTLKTYVAVAATVPTLDTLAASGETSMHIRYTGSTAPTLTKTAAGEYTLTIASGTTVTGFVWYGTGGTLTGTNSVKLTITDAAADMYANYTVLQSTTGDNVNSLVSTRQTRPTAYSVLTEFFNVGSISGTYIIIGKPL